MIKGSFGLVKSCGKKIDFKNFLAKSHYNKCFNKLNKEKQEKILKYIKMCKN